MYVVQVVAVLLRAAILIIRLSDANDRRPFPFHSPIAHGRKEKTPVSTITKKPGFDPGLPVR